MEINITAILLAVAIISGLGLLLGLGLGYAGEKFEVEENPRISEIMSALPGANCGGCGYSGCEAFATAVLSGDANVDSCGVNSSENVKKIFDIIGISLNFKDRQIAYIKCVGNFLNSSYKYDYYGMEDCRAMIKLAGGAKACSYGCLGGGNCVRACTFEAIEIKDGLAIVNMEKCTACGICIKKCPRSLIGLKPYKISVSICCNSADLGKIVKSFCKVGCIGCKLCVRACKFEAICVNDNVAVIDYNKCRGCNVCVKKCPMGAIVLSLKADKDCAKG